MSLITLITYNQPSFAGFEFDAILEDTLEASVNYTSYPIENGANVVDHGIIQPLKWSLIGAVSNSPLKPVATDFTGVITDLIDDGRIAQLLGTVTGFLSGSDDSRASSALTQLISLMVLREPFDVFTGDLTLSNMVVTDIKRVKNPQNEGGLIFEAQLQELALLDTIESIGRPKQSQLPNNDPAKTQAAELLNKGEKILRDVGDKINKSIADLLP